MAAWQPVQQEVTEFGKFLFGCLLFPFMLRCSTKSWDRNSDRFDYRPHPVFAGHGTTS